MTIEEILNNAGVTDVAIIEAVKAEMPKSFMPLADANKRIAAAKQDAEAKANELEQLKAAHAKQLEDAANQGQGQANELEQLKQQHEALQKQFAEAQEKAKQTAGREALVKALKEAGANPAAVELMASSALAGIEYDADGKPANVQDVADHLKEGNAGLFGTQVDTGTPGKKADNPNDLLSAFDEGFGETKRH